MSEPPNAERSVIDDPLLPAAAHLSGPHAGDVVRPAVESAGGELRSLTRTGMHYRAGADLVVRFRAEVAWHGGEPTRETLLAATTTAGPPPGTVPVIAGTTGGELEVGVWRWPFDPALGRLESLLRASGVHDLLVGAGLVAGGPPPELRVRAYRPTDRVVVRVRAGDRTWYLKIVPPERAASIERLHRRLTEQGLPVPRVAAADTDAGWVLFNELPGPTLRELIKADAPTWIEPATFRSLVTTIATLDPDGFSPTRSRLREAPAHAELLARVLPAESERLRRLAAYFRDTAATTTDLGTKVVHGDLHEAQMIVDAGRICGLLDVDDLGVGDPIDDVAVAVGHLRHRAMRAPGNHDRIASFADELAASFAIEHGPDRVATGVAAVLLGIAGAPFRAQREGWPQQVAAGLDLVERTLADAGR